MLSIETLGRKSLLLLLCVAAHSHAHLNDLRGLQPLDWHNPQVHSVTAVGEGFDIPEALTMDVEGRRCIRANALSIDVLDDFAFDVDETIELEIEFDLHNSYSMVGLWYDISAPKVVSTQVIGNGVGRLGARLPVGQASRWHRQTFVLERARFAGLGPGESDLFLTVASGQGESNATSPPVMTLCDIRFKRSYTTPQPNDFGRLNLTVRDPQGNPVPARIGLYDASGRAPLPASDAIDIKWGRSLRKLVEITPGYGGPWPVDNVRVFYIDGNYTARLPVGNYRLVVSRGMEFEILERQVKIRRGRARSVDIELKQWAPMAQQGWFSGDTHLHIGRGHSKDDRSILTHIKAEGVNVGNLLEMGDIAATFFKQYNWAPEGIVGDKHHFLVPGQEDPRTSRLGHMIGLNLKKPVRDTDRYYLYHRVFEGISSQGGVAGYSHLDTSLGYRPMIDPLGGLALDVPFGLVDFVEIMHGTGDGKQSWINPAWFDFLNLGFRLAPAAGTDYMDNAKQPGAVRTYVYLGKETTKTNLSTHDWFVGLKSGNSFVTSGPMISMTVNGQLANHDVSLNHADELTISATVSLNRQIDWLDRLELYEQGEKVAEVNSRHGEESLTLDHRVRVNRGTWFVLLAFGKNRHGNGAAIAATAPVYVQVGEGESGFCKLSEVKTIADRMKARLLEIPRRSVAEQREVRPWGTGKVREKQWPVQKPLVENRIQLALQKYDELAMLAREGKCLQQ